MDVLEKGFVRILTCYYEFWGSVAIHKSWEDFPKETHYSRSVKNERLLKSASVIHWNTRYNFLDSRIGQVPDIINTFEIVDDVPVFHLSW